ncbi:ribonuclease H1 [Trichophyton mentagrophytes]|nr:ribonuclease H1 [Trichophyton mentagrophytes]
MLFLERNCPRDSCFRRIGCFRYNPFEIYHNNVDVSQLEIDEGRWVLLTCGNLRRCDYCGKPAAYIDSIVIAVDGACSNNGTPYAQAGLGIYFGSRSSFNISLALDIDEPTNQKAELMAAIGALQMARDICVNGSYGKPIVNVTIKSDSEYLVRAATEWIPKWETNGYTNAKGKPVVNGELFKWLDACIFDLNAEGVAVHFWHVERAYNCHADRLAKQAVSR